MISKRPWKLVPLAAMFALGLFMFAGGPSVPTARAAATIDQPDDLASGEEITITVNAEISGGNLTVTVTGDNTTDMTLAVDDCTPNCTAEDNGAEAETDNQEVQVVIDTEDVTGTAGNPLEVTLTFTATCEADDELTIEVDQDSGTGTLTDSTTFLCQVGNVIIIKEAPDDDTLEFDFTIEGDSSCDDSFVMVDGDEVSFDCDESETYTVTEDLPSGWTVSIDCEDDGIPTADVVISDEDGTVEFTLGPGDSIICTFTNEEGPGGGGAPATVTVSAAPNSVNCNSISFVSIVVKDAAGAGVADGTAVQVATTIGSLNQTATTTTGGGGGATVIFTSPSNSGGTATITATSGGKTGSAPITVTCSAATAVPPTVAVAAATARPAVVSPPSTGDAGLAADGDSSWQLMAIALLVTGSLLGGLVVARRRA